MILDATCSARRNWPKIADVRVDVDPRVRPDVIADATSLPFVDESFDEVYADPPHFIRFRGDGKWQLQFDHHLDSSRSTYARYSSCPDRSAWERFLDRSAGEFFRVLRQGGALFYKIPDGSRSHGRMADYREVVEVSCRHGFALRRFESRISEGLFSRGNVKRGRSPSIIFEIEFGKDGR